MRRLSHALPALLLALPFPAATARAQETGERETLELSLDEVVERALENNIDIAVEKYTPLTAQENLRGAKGGYDTFLSAVVDHNDRTTPATNAFTGGEQVTQTTQNWSFGAFQALPTGGDIQLSFNNRKTDEDSVFTTFNPIFSTNLNVFLTQPLLRGLKIDSTRQNIRIRKNNVEISDTQFRQVVINVVANVKSLYYDLIFAIDNLAAQRNSLALAQKLLEENRIKVRVGTLAPLDVVSAESEVATRQESVIVAEAALEDAQDAIKQVIFSVNDPDMWDINIVPTDRATAEPREIDVQAAIENALANRTDVQITRRNLENNQISLDFARNQVLPAVDLEASYGTIGVGGTSLIRDDFGGNVIERIPGGYGDALSQTFGRDFPTWSVGLRVSYPILNRSAKANAALSRIAQERAELGLQRLELQVTREVRSAARRVATDFQRVETTRAARVLSARRLDAEEKRFAAGMSTNFFVTQAQRDLAFSEVSELQAIADYLKSLIEFDRVQEAGLGGVTITGGAGNATGGTGGGVNLNSGLANQGPN
jgi:outer membrane protein TolC